MKDDGQLEFSLRDSRLSEFVLLRYVCSLRDRHGRLEGCKPAVRAEGVNSGGGTTHSLALGGDDQTCTRQKRESRRTQ